MRSGARGLKDPPTAPLVAADRLHRISEGVFRLEDRFVNLYLLDLGKIVLVDTGTKRAEPEIRAGLRELGKEVQDIAVVLLTHHHTDHVGTAAVWTREARAQVDIHRVDAPVAAHRERRRTRGIGLGPKVMAAFMGVFVPLMRTAPVEADRVLDGGETLDLFGHRVEVVHAPGHTLGSCAYILRDAGVLFAGDAVNGRAGVAEPPALVEDRVAATESFRRLTSMNPGLLCPGHGSPVPRSA